MNRFSSMSRFKKITLGVIAFIILAPLAGFIYQSVAENAEKASFPPPGQMVSLGDFSLHLDCRGTSEVTIVMEAGAGGTSLSWSAVQPELTENLRVCTYDRAGMGWSEPGPSPRSGTQIVSELNLLLENAGIDGPLVLVGHSFGGLLVQQYARQFPHQVAGLVLVDAVHPDFIRNLPDVALEQRENQFASMRFAGILAKIGVVRLFKEVNFPDAMPQDVRGAVAALALRAQTAKTIYEEAIAFDQDVARMQALPYVRAGLPVAVVSRAYVAPENVAEGVTSIPGLWEEYQQRLARLTSDTTRYVAATPEHYIQFSQPELVIRAIRDVVERAQAARD